MSEVSEQIEVAGVEQREGAEQREGTEDPELITEEADPEGDSYEDSDGISVEESESDIVKDIFDLKDIRASVKGR